jgi:hypothetical protein
VARRFLKATGFVTMAERDLDPAPGSLVFHPTRGPVPVDDFRQWWSIGFRCVVRA